MALCGRRVELFLRNSVLFRGCIVVDLKGKIDLSAYDLSEGMPEGGNAPEVAAVSDEAQRALKMLGFPEAAIRKAVKAVLGADAHLPVEEVIKQALKRL